MVDPFVVDDYLRMGEIKYNNLYLTTVILIIPTLQVYCNGRYKCYYSKQL